MTLITLPHAGGSDAGAAGEGLRAQQRDRAGNRIALPSPRARLCPEGDVDGFSSGGARALRFSGVIRRYRRARALPTRTRVRLSEVKSATAFPEEGDCRIQSSPFLPSRQRFFISPGSVSGAPESQYSSSIHRSSAFRSAFQWNHVWFDPAISAKTSSSSSRIFSSPAT